jgi:hypothetical protein
MAAQGKVDEGIAQMENALGMYRGVGSGMVVPYFLTQLAEAYALAGNLHGRTRETRRCTPDCCGRRRSDRVR